MQRGPANLGSLTPLRPLYPRRHTFSVAVYTSAHTLFPEPKCTCTHAYQDTFTPYKLTQNQLCSQQVRDPSPRSKRFSLKSVSQGGGASLHCNHAREGWQALAAKAPWALSIWKKPVGVRIFAHRAAAPAPFSQCARSCKSHFPGLLLGLHKSSRACLPINFSTNEPEILARGQNRLDLLDCLPAAMQESGLAAG